MHLYFHGVAVVLCFYDLYSQDLCFEKDVVDGAHGSGWRRGIAAVDESWSKSTGTFGVVSSETDDDVDTLAPEGTKREDDQDLASLDPAGWRFWQDVMVNGRRCRGTADFTYCCGTPPP